ncbi:hypothetical protein GCM10010970_18750 [Silvimonas iriomotensis]|uniref:Carboxypeptidase regulatory-like domain-containing protein n=2 Tax=Silvimonas iriomotensis TaxID=449662 RepID=A0ABQ2P8R0_9NEIS|nr:hypothetical protein GCM10010970_18750 [Silvimonas iriomotensis]
MAAAVLSACGGGDGGSASTSSPSTSQPAAVTGTVATGQVMAGAAITIKDSSGKTVTATADANGNYSVSQAVYAGLTAPLLIKASNGQPGGDLYSVSWTAGAANVTPLTSMVVAALSGQLPADFFNLFGTSSKASALITAANVAAARQQVQTALTTAGIDPANIGDFFSATIVAGNAADKVLESTSATLPSVTAFTAQLAQATTQNNGGTPPSGGTAPSANADTSTFGGCMTSLALSDTLPSGIARTTLTTLPAINARWIATSYKMADVDAYGNPTWSVTRGADTEGANAAVWEMQPRQSGVAFQDNNGPITAQAQPTQLIVRSTNGDHLAFHLNLNDYFATIGGAYLGYQENGNADNPASVEEGADYRRGFYFAAGQTAEQPLDAATSSGQWYSRTRYTLDDATKTATTDSYRVAFYGMQTITTPLGSLNVCSYTANGTITIGTRASVVYSTMLYVTPTLGAVRRTYSETDLDANGHMIFSMTNNRDLTGVIIGHTNYGESLAGGTLWSQLLNQLQ